MSDEILEFRLHLSEEDMVLLLGVALGEQDFAEHRPISRTVDHAIWTRIVSELERSIAEVLRRQAKKDRLT